MSRQVAGTGAVAADLSWPAPAPVDRRHLTSIGGACAVRVARSVEEVESLRADWSPLLGDNVHADPDYILWSVREEPHVLRPHVLAIERGGRVEGIVVARIVNARLPCKLGHTTVYAPTVRALCVTREGWLGRVDTYTAEVILDELLARARSPGGRRPSLPPAGAGLGAASCRAGEGDVRDPPAARQPGRTCAGRSSSSRRSRAYLGSVSPSTRKTVRRTSSRLERDFGERLSIKVFRDASDLDALLGDVEAVASRTYQRRLGVGFLGHDRQRARLAALAAHGWLRGYVLYLDGQPIAFELGELYRGRFDSLAGAYAPGPRSTPGRRLPPAEGDRGSRSRARLLFDFGFGDAEYKSKLAHRRFEEGDLVIYARRPRPIWIKFARTALLEISRAVTAGLTRLALMERIKQWSRRPALVAASARILEQSPLEHRRHCQPRRDGERRRLGVRRRRAPGRRHCRG